MLGIGIVDDLCKGNFFFIFCLVFGGKKVVVIGNLVKGNILKDNVLDIYKNIIGKGNEVCWNKCKILVFFKFCGVYCG